jgi:transcriptional regulator with XRE-family HTH domain
MDFCAWHYASMRVSDMAKAFGVVLKKHREEKGISQEVLAEKADIHPTHVSLIERFERNPSLNVAESLAQALGIPLADLIREAQSLRHKR